eukprot:COSAG02_NODE_62074_length_267_cov_0.547619_1_plen_68_part_10
MNNAMTLLLLITTVAAGAAGALASLSSAGDVRLQSDDTAASLPGNSRARKSPHTLRLGFNVGYLSDSQ